MYVFLYLDGKSIDGSDNLTLMKVLGTEHDYEIYKLLYRVLAENYVPTTSEEINISMNFTEYLPDDYDDVIEEPEGGVIQTNEHNMFKETITDKGAYDSDDGGDDDNNNFGYGMR